MFTRTDGGLDTGMVDIGRHYSAGGLAENYKLTVTVRPRWRNLTTRLGGMDRAQYERFPNQNYFIGENEK
jgi:hypothetical protein